MYRSFYRDPADVGELIEALGLAAKRGDYYRSLSGGQRQRLSVALALIGRPKIAVLDEMTTGLDPQARRDAWDLIEGIRDRGVTILLVTHFMEEAERLCDRVALIDDGRVVALDTPAGLAARASGGKTVRFLPSAPFDDRLLTELPEVTRVDRSGPARRRHRDRRARQRGDPHPGRGRRDRPRRPARLVEPRRRLRPAHRKAPHDDAIRKEHAHELAHDAGAQLSTAAPGPRRRRRAPRSARSCSTRPGSPGGGRRPDRRRRLPLLLLIIFGELPAFKQHPPAFGGPDRFDVYVPILAVFGLAMLGADRPAAAAGVLPRAGGPAPAVDHPGAPVLGARRAGRGPAAHRGGRGRRSSWCSITAFGAPRPKSLAGLVLSVALSIAGLFAIGLLFAAVARTSTAANVIGRVAFFPLMFFAGLWLPRALMPRPPARYQQLHPARGGRAGDAGLDADRLPARRAAAGPGRLRGRLRLPRPPLLPLGVNRKHPKHTPPPTHPIPHATPPLTHPAPGARRLRPAADEPVPRDATPTRPVAYASDTNRPGRWRR